MKWSDITAGQVVMDGVTDEISARVASENPALYQSATQMFLRAGARILRCPSADAVRLAREISTSDTAIWGAVGSSGKILSLKELSKKELEAYYRARIEQLSAGDPDAILIHSQDDLDEAVIALKAARKACRLKLGVSLTFGSGPDQTDTVMGNSAELCARTLSQEGADLIGCNCALATDGLVLVVRLLRAHCALPILACPDAGQRELDGDRIVHRETPEDFASKCGSLFRAGACVVGGCCGVSDAHIRALAQAIAA